MLPSIPGDIASRAYNAMSGGIRWTHSTDDRGVRGYEVSRDGSMLGVFDALSDIDRSLSAGRAYNYAVVAIDTAGQRSARATVRLIMPDAPPPTPTDLTRIIYTQAESHFQRHNESINLKLGNLDFLALMIQDEVG